MISTILHHNFIDQMYHNLQMACAKSGFKVVAVDKEKGFIAAEKRKVFGLKTILNINVHGRENNSTKINVLVKKNEVEDNVAEQKVLDVISEYL